MWPNIVTVCQSGEILPNLVTLVSTLTFAPKSSLTILCPEARCPVQSCLIFFSTLSSHLYFCLVIFVPFVPCRLESVIEFNIFRRNFSFSFQIFDRTPLVTLFSDLHLVSPCHGKSPKIRSSQSLDFLCSNFLYTQNHITWQAVRCSSRRFKNLIH